MESVRVRDNGLLTDFVGLEGVSTVASELVIDGNRAAADPGTPPHSGTAQRERDSVCVCVCVSAPGDTRVQGSSNCMGRGGTAALGQLLLAQGTVHVALQGRIYTSVPQPCPCHLFGSVHCPLHNQPKHLSDSCPWSGPP
jgi:hypothetical protein